MLRPLPFVSASHPINENARGESPRAFLQKIGSRLEPDLRPELHGAWISYGVDLPEQSRSDVRAGDAAEVRLVEDIEHLSPELDAILTIVAEAHVLGHRKVDAFGCRTVDSSAACVTRSVRHESADRGIRLEARRIEPLLDRVRGIRIRIA